MTTRLRCGCPGSVGIPGSASPCPFDASQEDLLCDHCRALGCATLTLADLGAEDGWPGCGSWGMAVLDLCRRRGCSIHAWRPRGRGWSVGDGMILREWEELDPRETF